MKAKSLLRLMAVLAVSLFLRVSPAEPHPDLQVSVALVDSLLAARPDSAALHLLRAQLARESGDYAGADRALDRAAAVSTLRPWVTAIRSRWAGRAVPLPAGAEAGAGGSVPARVTPASGWPGIVGAAPQVTRGPYLQMASPQAVTVRWRTDLPTGSRVVYGPSPGNLNLAQVDPTLRQEHELRLPGLASATRYFYAVGTDSLLLAGADSSYTFRTPPLPGTRSPMRMWVIGDAGDPLTAPGTRDGFAAFQGALDCDFWLMLGDNAYPGGTDAQYQAAVFDVYPTLLRRSTVWPTHGNHDIIYPGGGNDYYDIFSLPTAGECGGHPSASEAYYSFDHANVHFICLDSQDESRLPGGPMLNWLAQDLAATTREWVIAFWHHPPYSKGSHDSDTDTGGKQKEMRENALPLLEAAGVDLVLTGHSHSYERSFLLDEHYGLSATLVDSMIIDGGDGRVLGDGAYVKPTPGRAPHEGAVHAVAGSSSRLGGGTLDHPVMVSSLNVLGSMVIDVDGLRLDGRFIDVNGTVRDDFTLFKGTPGGVEAPLPGARLELAAPTPNPFGASTSIAWTQSRDEAVRIDVFDVRGRSVARVLDDRRSAGHHAVEWRGRDDRDRPVTPGIYLVVLRVDGQVEGRKVVRLRP